MFQRPRRVVFCVSDRPAEAEAAFGWAAECLLERSDSVAFVAYRQSGRETFQWGYRILPAGAAPDWLPPSSTREESLVVRVSTASHALVPPVAARVSSPDAPARQRCFEVVGDLSAGDALASWVESSTGLDVLDNNTQTNKLQEIDTIIVLGSRGHTGVKKLLMGRFVRPRRPLLVPWYAPVTPLLSPLPPRSCVSQVLARGVAPCVVVRSTLPPQPPPSAPGASRRRVAIAVDSSPSGAALCGWASAALLRTPSDEVTLLHARSDRPGTPQAEAAAADAALEVLKLAVSRLRDAPGRVNAGYVQLSSGEEASPTTSTPPPLEPKMVVLSNQSSGAAIVSWCDAHRPHMLVRFHARKGVAGACCRFANSFLTGHTSHRWSAPAARAGAAAWAACRPTPSPSRRAPCSLWTRQPWRS